MALYTKYVNRTEFNSYEDFKVNFLVNVPENFNYSYDVVDVLAEQEPDKKALVWCNVEGEEKILTFGELAQKVNQCANYFQSKGIKRGDAVLLILKRHYQFWYAVLALHKLGAVGVPATVLLTAKDIAYRLEQANVKMVVCTAQNDAPAHVKDGVEQSGRKQVILSCTGDQPGFENFDEQIEGYAPEFTRPAGDQATQNDDVMLLYFTSGTTGFPKMVTHDFTYPLAHIVTAKYWHNCTEGGLHLTVAETGWMKSVWGKLYGQWLCGSAVFVYDFDKFEPRALLDKIRDYQITTFCAPPTIYRFFIKEDIRPEDFASVKQATIAGEPLNPEVYSQFLSLTGLELREAYGQTEMCVATANYNWLKVKPGSMGKASPGYVIDILSEQGRSCRTGESGEMVLRANRQGQLGIFKEYYKDEKRTEQAWKGGVYHTGDVAWKDEQGYFWYVGRSDDVIKSSGYRIGPFEVESALLEHPGVLECAITGVPDPERGAVVKATITLTKGYLPSQQLKKDLQEHVKSVTAPYKYPRIIEFVDALPKTISGKIRRVEIRENDEKK